MRYRTLLSNLYLVKFHMSDVTLKTHVKALVVIIPKGWTPLTFRQVLAWYSSKSQISYGEFMYRDLTNNACLHLKKKLLCKYLR